MEWTTGTRRRAMVVAISVIFDAGVVGYAHAQQVGQPAGDVQKSSKAQSAATPDSTLPEISVSAGADDNGTVGLVAKRSATGTKTDTPLNEIPQTINVVTAAQIEQTGAASVNDALRYVPGFSTYGSEVRSDWYSVLRGFTPTVYTDGLAVPTTINLASWRVDPFMIDSITVLRGPSSVLYGQGDPGAIVDVQSKLANGERIREVQMQLGDYARKQIAFDIGDKIDADGKLSYRVLGVGRDGNSLTGPNSDRRIAFSPSVKWQPDANTSLTAALTYLQDHGDASNNFLPAQGTILPNPNGTISENLYTGDPNFSHYRKKQWSAGYQFEHKFDPVWTFRQNLRLMHLSLDQGQVFGGGLDADDPTQQSLVRYVGDYQFNYSRFDIDNQAQAKFKQGPFDHTVLLGLEYNRQRTSDTEFMARGPNLNLYNPVYVPITNAIFSTPAAFAPTDTRTTLSMLGAYAQDQIKWRRWTLTVGGRQDWSDTKQSDLAGGTSFQQNDHAFSGRVGLAYLGDYGLSPYLSYSTSFNPVIGVRMASGGLAAPTKGRQVEAGVRWQPEGKNLTLNGALYQIYQNNVLTPDPNDPTQTFSVQTGQVRSRGLELSAVGNITREFSIISAYVYQDVKNTQANDSSLGKWPVDIPRPRQMASLWGDWTWHTGALSGFGLGAGIRYQSSAAGASDNSLLVPSNTVYDAGAHYDMQNWRFTLNASNLFNRRFVSGCQSVNTCFYGNQRTVVASAKYVW